MTQEAATIGGFWVAVVALAVSGIGFGVAVFALRRSNLNSSAAIVLTLTVNFRDAWNRFLNSNEQQQDFEFHELMNLIEAACAIHRESSLVGKSGKLIEKYLTDILGYLEKNAGARERITAMRHQSHTFEHCVAFLVKMKRKGRLKVMADLMELPEPVRTPPEVSPVEATNTP